ncbi:MAG: RNA polymerase sigma factor [bacterium]|nr:RNA polymerase sigma factor [bacterium]
MELHKDLLEVKKILSGDHEVFNDLYENHFRKIYNYVYMKLGNHNDAEDLTQDVFVAVVESLENYQGRSSIICWIFSITKNLLRNWYRNKKHAVHAFDADDTEFQNTFFQDRLTPLNELEYTELLNDWCGKLQSLPSEQSEVFYLKHFNGLSLREIAKVTQKSVGSIKTTLYRTKKLLLDATLCVNA